MVVRAVAGLETVLVLSAAAGSGAYMLTRAEIFAPFRAWVAGRTKGGSRFWSWLHRLLSCPYCTGTWLALAAVAIWRPVLLPGPLWSYWPLGYLTVVMAVNGTAMAWVLIIRRALGK